MKTLNAFLTLLTLSAVFIFAAGCCGVTEKEYVSGGSASVDPQPTSSSRGGQLEILNSEFEWGQFGNLYVVGTAKNVGDKTLSYAQIDVKFYDNDGALLQTMLDNIRDLGPGETWKFKVIYPDIDTQDVASFKIASGTSF